MRINKLVLFALVLFLLTACAVETPMTEPTIMAVSPTSITVIPSVSPTATTTPTPIIQYIEVTRLITVIPTEIYTPTPTRDTAQECFKQAMTQGDMNSCAALMRDLAEAELEATIERITYLSFEDKITLEQKVLNWKDLAWQDCEYLYGKLVTDSSGNLNYERGSSAPMQTNICIAKRIKQHIQELIYAYLSE